MTWLSKPRIGGREMTEPKFVCEAVYGAEGFIECFIIRAANYPPPYSIKFPSPLPIFLDFGCSMMRGVINFDNYTVFKESEVRKVPETAEEE